MKRCIFPTLLIAAFLLSFGCALPPQRPIRVTEKPQRTVAPLLPEEKVGEEIGFLTSLVDEGNLSNKQKVVAQNLLSTYQGIKKNFTQPISEEDYRQIIRELFGSLMTLEKPFFLKTDQEKKAQKLSITLFSEKRKDILKAYLAGDYPGVINQCLKLKNNFGPDALTPEIGMIFSLALAREGMLEEAIDIGSGVVRELEKGPGLILLETKIAEWQSRVGQDDAAEFNYEKVSDLMDERKALVENLKNELGYVSPTSQNGQNIAKKTESEKKETQVAAPNAMTALLDHVKKLVDAHQFEDARAVLVKKKNEPNISASDAQAIDQALEKLDQAENAFLQERITSLGQANTEQQIRDLLDEQKYTEAIAMIEGLTPDVVSSPKIQALRQEAVRKLINQQRNRAAELFLQARKATDPAEKKQYLQTAHDILQSLLDKYPSSSLSNEIKSNLKMVDDQLGKL